jgi:hypothetical protein
MRGGRLYHITRVKHARQAVVEVQARREPLDQPYDQEALGMQRKQQALLAMSYFPGELPLQYRHRCTVSRPCSRWERVGPVRSNHQESLSTKSVMSNEKRVTRTHRSLLVTRYF